jgi:predicted transcriptional regulator
MKQLCDLLFEFSSAERMNIMQSLLKKRLKLSQVSKNLDMTVTEASRHLQRLSDIQLIEKDADGAFGPTSYGRAAVRLLSGLDFVSDNYDYFLEHEVLGLPDAFVDRIGALSYANLNTDIVRVLAYVNDMFQEAEEYMWVMSYSYSLPSAIPIVEERLEKGVTLRTIVPKDLVQQTRDPKTMLGPWRVLPELDLRLMITDKEAMCSLPSLDGKPDYTSYIGKDQRFHSWCKDLYLYYWEQAEPM